MIEYHAFKSHGKNFLYLPEYQQVFVINDEFFELLRNKDKSLSRQKEALLSYVTKNLDIRPSVDIEKSNNRRNALFLMVATVCNSQCIYCFANEGTYNKDEEIMSTDIGIKAVKMFIDSIPQKERKNNNFIIFFGGEPLMAWDTIRDVTNIAKTYAISKNTNVSFRLVTNGTLLDKEKIDFIAKNNISLTISIDGPPEIQNHQRPLKNGKESFDAIAKNLPYLFNRIPEVLARATYVNFDYPLYKIYYKLFEIGFTSADVVPDILNIEEENLEKLLLQLEKMKPYLFKEILKGNIKRYGPFADRFLRIFGKKVKREDACGAGNRIISVAPDGNVYLCHRYTSEENLIIGNVFDGYKKWYFTSNGKELACKKCWNRYLCSSGCYYNNQKNTGDPLYRYKPWCAYSKKMSEICLSLLSEIESRKIKDAILGMLE